jgi:hypothetical protein
VTVVTTLGCLFLSAPRLRRIKRPAFPAPSDFREREILANLGRMARRDRGLIFGFDVIARSKATTLAPDLLSKSCVRCSAGERGCAAIRNRRLASMGGTC